MGPQEIKIIINFLYKKKEKKTLHFAREKNMTKNLKNKMFFLMKQNNIIHFCTTRKFFFVQKYNFWPYISSVNKKLIGL